MSIVSDKYYGILNLLPEEVMQNVCDFLNSSDKRRLQQAHDHPILILNVQFTEIDQKMLRQLEKAK